MKKIPERTCVVTKEKLPKKELIRIVRNKDGEVFVDETGKLSGRGAYLKKDKDVILLAKKNKALEGFKKNPKNSHISDYWLFLTVPDRTFCGIDDLKMSQPIISDYERIYICDSMHVMQLK